MTKRIIAFTLIIAVSSCGIFLLNWLHEQGTPRRLEVGDTWSYVVVFPDSHQYTQTDIVQADLPNDTYLIFRDDNQHISTGYLWLTDSWHETRESRMQIGNLMANSTSTYDPPIELIRIPLRVGDEWNVDSNLTIRTSIGNQTEILVSIIHQMRETVSKELIHTPIGNFQSFVINVTTGRSLYETVWFSVELGQIVYAKFYNSLGESVTESLVGYRLSESVENTVTIFSNPDLSYGIPTEVLCTSHPKLSTELKNLYG